MSELKAVMERRITEKVLVDPAAPIAVGDNSLADIDNLLASAGNAPFHYQTSQRHREKLSSPVPWRMYKLDGANCRALLRRLIDRSETVIIRNMLAAADYVILTTWTPDPVDESHQLGSDASFLGNMRNMEHIAAGSAAVQNLLLLATEAGWSTYWSSGGVLRSEEIFDLLDIPTKEILLGAIFLFPAERPTAETRQGKLRDARGSVDDWSKWVVVAPE
ncbi:MAG: hypothetical protein AAF709_01330 [Pseudomonadota bacterium]